jgi:CspA family cold shock protein
MALEGTVKWYREDKGHGFITVDNGREVGVDRRAILAEGRVVLHEGQRVSLDVVEGRRGPEAANVVTHSWLSGGAP